MHKSIKTNASEIENKAETDKAKMGVTFLDEYNTLVVR